MMRRKEMKQLLEERAERIGLLEQRTETLEQLVEGYKAREHAVVETLSRANETATRQVEEAQKRAMEIGRNAEAHAGRIASEAQRQADAILTAARAESERMLAQAKQNARDYETALAQYNANLERSAAEAEAIASRYAAFLKQRKVDQGELFNEAGAGVVTAPLGAVDLPDPSDSPKTLMQNIYRLQNRDIPEAARAPEEAAADLIDEIIADLGPRPADLSEPAPAPEPPAPAQPVAPVQPVAPAQPVTPVAPVIPAPPVYVPEPPAAPVPEQPVSMTHAVPKPGHASAQEPVWQQEQEIEWQDDEGGDVPSVSELMPDSAQDGDVSLDSLLDEIISAGNI